MKLNLSALGNTDLNKLVKRDYKLVNNETIHHFSVVELSNNDIMIVVVSIENADSYFYANGSLKNFLIDNIDILEKNNNGQYLMYDYNVKISYNGQVETKKGYLFTSWEIIIPD